MKPRTLLSVAGAASFALVACVGATERNYYDDRSSTAGADASAPGVGEFTVGGTLAGLVGRGLVLENGKDTLKVGANGAFTFPTKVADGGGYAVRVKTAPSEPAQGCSVSSGAGTVRGANVTNVIVTCSTNRFTVGGTVSGLGPNKKVTLAAGADVVVVDKDGAFTLPTALLSGSAYEVTVQGQPDAQTCTVANATGSVGAANVENLVVACTNDTFGIGGQATGLIGAGLVLKDSVTGESLSVPANGTFTFLTKATPGTSYAVQVNVQPARQICTLQNATGTVTSAAITNIAASCLVKEDFDGVSAPALPGGWSATEGNGQPAWATSTAKADTAANSAYAADPPVVTDNQLVSANFPVQTTAAQLTFRHAYDFEIDASGAWDGGVLEMSLDNGAWTDVGQAAFQAGGYTSSLIGGANPLGVRPAFTGNSNGFVTTVVNLPANAAGKTARFRFRVGTDNFNAGAFNGWNVDTLRFKP